MTTDREQLRALLSAVEGHLGAPLTAAAPYLALRRERDRVIAHLASTVEPHCSCGTPGLNYDGPQVDCEMHGNPAEAYAAGYRAGFDDGTAAR